MQLPILIAVFFVLITQYGSGEKWDDIQGARVNF